jgi:serine/threonine protein kinase
MRIPHLKAASQLPEAQLPKFSKVRHRTLVDQPSYETRYAYLSNNSYSCAYPVKRVDITVWKTTNPIFHTRETEVYLCWHIDTAGTYYPLVKKYDVANKSDIPPPDEHSLMQAVGQIEEIGGTRYEKFMGETLIDYCNNNRLTSIQCVELFRKIAVAINNMHKQGYVHGDLKLDNLTYDNTQVHVIDILEKDVHKFESYEAALQGKQILKGTDITVTPGHCAPEVIPFSKKAEESQCQAKNEFKQYIMLRAKGQFTPYLSAAADAYAFGKMIKNIMQFSHDQQGPEHITTALHDLANELCRKNRRRRPNLEECAARLEQILNPQNEAEIAETLEAIQEKLRELSNQIYYYQTNSTYSDAAKRAINRIHHSLNPKNHLYNMALFNPRRFRRKITRHLNYAITLGFPKYALRHRKVALVISSFLPLIGAVVLLASRYMKNTALHHFFWYKKPDFREGSKLPEFKQSQLTEVPDLLARPITLFNQRHVNGDTEQAQQQAASLQLTASAAP